MSGPLWREQVTSGSGDRTTLFDGTDVFQFEKGDSEYERVHGSSKDNNEPALAEPYCACHANWKKAVEAARKPCGLSTLNHECVVIDVPLSPSIGNKNGKQSRTLNGTSRFVVDTQTGIVLAWQNMQTVDDGTRAYQVERRYTLARFAFGGPKQDSLFRLPANVMKEVKELSHWDASRINKELVGQAAPDFTTTDLEAKPVSILALKGKTVLLDFWATWCGPCRADGPALDKLYQKYGGHDLAIIAISVDEDRAIVEKFLSEHPHPYPVVLTSENDVPRQYRFRAVPTYVVIDKEGKVAAATEGEKGFGGLRKALNKAGLESE